MEEGTTIFIDNYSITQSDPAHYHIKKNGTPVASYRMPRGMTLIEMKEFLLDYIDKVTGESLGGKHDTK